MPHGVCVLRDGHVLVADSGKSRVVAYRRPEGEERYHYVCQVDMEYPFGFAEDRTDLSLVYVSCMRQNAVKAVKFTGERLQVTRTLTAQGRLADPRDLTMDSTGRYLYVACQDGVHKVSLASDTVLATLKSPDEFSSFPWGVAVVQDKILVSYPTEKSVVLYPRGETSSGEILKFPGLQRPRGLGEDGDHFLVSDYKAECFFVVTPQGQLAYKIGARSTWPMDITAAEGLLYVADVKNHRIMILGN